MELTRLPRGIPVTQVSFNQESPTAKSLPTKPGLTNMQFTCTELENIMSSSNSGAWKYYMHTDRLELCPVSAKLLGLNSGIQFNLYKIIRHLIGLQASLLIKALKAACHDQTHVDEEIKIRSKSGDLIWLKVTGDLYRHDGYACKMMGTINDMTELKNKHERKMDLMAFLNHELRTPLSIAKLYIQKTYQLAVQQRNTKLEDMLAKADYQAVQMTAMIDNYLTLSRLEVAPMLVQTTSFNLGAMVLEMISDLKLIYPGRHFSTMQLVPVMVRADREKIRQVLNNYLTNAVKYSPDHSTIHLAFSRQSGQVKVAVGDEGLGVAEEEQEFLFNRYYRAHEKDTIRAGGFGLGLYLSREIIESHGGKVWVKSKPGIGSTFGFTLPDHL